MIDIAQIYAFFDDSHKDLKKVVERPFLHSDEGLKVIKSKNFFNYVRLSVGASTLYQVERMFSRKPGSSSTDKWIDAKKWRNYQHGYRIPTTRTIEAAEQIAKKAFKQELNLVLWSVLDRSSPMRNRTRQLIRRLQPEDRKLARICDKLFQARGEHTAAIRQVCATLTANPSLDRLAIVTLFLRKAQESSKLDRCCIFTVATFKILLLLGAELSKRRIAADIYWYYSYHIFDLIIEDVGGLMIGAELIHLLAFVTSTNEPTLTIDESEGFKRINRFLNGEHGSAFPQTFLPNFHPSMYDSKVDIDQEDLTFESMQPFNEGVILNPSYDFLNSWFQIFDFSRNPPSFHPSMDDSKSDLDQDHEDLSLDSKQSFYEDCDLKQSAGFLNTLVQIFAFNRIPRIFNPNYVDPDLNFKFFSLAVCRKSAAIHPVDTVPWLGLKY